MRRVTRWVWDVPRAGSPPGARWVSQAGDVQPLPYQDIPSTGGSGWANLYRQWRDGQVGKLHLIIERNFQRLGPIYRDNVGPRESVYIFQPEDTMALFRAEGHNPERLLLEAWVEHRELRKHKRGIFLKNGDEWRRDRMMLNPEVIGPAATGKFATLLDPVARDVTLLVDRRLQTGDLSEARNILPDLFRFALESSFNLFYGKRLGLFGDSDLRQADHLIQSVEKMLKTTTPLLYMPPWLARRLGLRAWREHVQAWDHIFEHAHHSLAELLRKIRTVPEADRGYLGILGELLTRSGLSFDIIRANATELLVGSVDTTAHSLLFTLFELARNPELQEALRREVTEAHRLAQGDMNATLRNVPLLRAAIKETLRLYPIGLTLQRYSVTDAIIRNYRIPAGTLVQVGLYSLGRSPEVFTDPGTYNPARWLSAHSHSFQALAFGFGVRQCIGRRVAETEISIFLIHILRKFQIVTSSSADIELTYTFIVMVNDPPLLAFRALPGQGARGTRNLGAHVYS